MDLKLGDSVTVNCVWLTIVCMCIVPSVLVKGKGKGFPMLDTERWAWS